MSNMARKSKVKVRLSFFPTGIETMTTVLAEYLSVGDMDAHRANSAYGTVATREHCMHRGEDVEKVSEEPGAERLLENALERPGQSETRCVEIGAGGSRRPLSALQETGKDIGSCPNA